jgi:hypothetical protein
MSNSNVEAVEGEYWKYYRDTLWNEQQQLSLIKWGWNMVTELEDDLCYTHVLLSNNELLIFRNDYFTVSRYILGEVQHPFLFIRTVLSGRSETT